MAAYRMPPFLFQEQISQSAPCLRTQHSTVLLHGGHRFLAGADRLSALDDEYCAAIAPTSVIAISDRHEHAMLQRRPNMLAGGGFGGLAVAGQQGGDHFRMLLAGGIRPGAAREKAR